MVDFFRFFDSFDTGRDSFSEDGSKSQLSFESQYALLCGSAKSGKTSLLLNYGASIAKENRTVLFLCNKKKIQQSNPVFPNENHPQFSSIMNRIKIKYFDDGKSLRAYLANIHLLKKIPSLIIMDDLSSILGSSNFTGMVASPTGSATRSFPGVSDIAKSLAFLRDAADYFTTCLQKLDLGKCQLLVSETATPDFTFRQLSTYERWLPTVFLVETQSTATNLPGQAPSVQTYGTLKLFKDNLNPKFKEVSVSFKMDYKSLTFDELKMQM